MNGPDRENHPSPNRLESFMRGEAPRDETRVIVRHLLTGCPKCVAVTGGMWQRGELPAYLKVLGEEANAAAARGRGSLPPFV